MAFDFNLYSTPLLFGFVQAWVYAVLFWLRAWRHERLSDGLFGALLVVFAFEIWEYMLGFAGVEVLWTELEFFPRNFTFLLPAISWLYLKSQFNSEFRLGKQHWIHALPFLLYVVYHVAVFVQGAEFVEWWKENVHFAWHLDYAELLLSLGLHIGYFYNAIRLYQQYRTWAPTQFSNESSVSFGWFRTFLICFFASSVLGWGMTLVDLWLDLDFWHDWWDELFNSGLIYYLCIAGYAQTQLPHLRFEPAPPVVTPQPETEEKLPTEELERWRQHIERVMKEEQPWLDPELSLPELARQLHTNVSLLSAVINGAFGKNFNDYINSYRVEAVKDMLRDPGSGHLSLVGVGLGCGFNSKSTFNRAFRKATGVSPSEWKQREFSQS